MGDAYACVMDARMLLLFLWCVRKDQRKLQLQRTEASVFYSAGVFSMGGSSIVQATCFAAAYLESLEVVIHLGD